MLYMVYTAKPKFLGQKSQINSLEHSDVTISCMQESLSAWRGVEWMKDGVVVSSNCEGCGSFNTNSYKTFDKKLIEGDEKYRIVRNGKLMLLGVSVEDQGLYQCVVISQDREWVASAVRLVIQKPAPIIS